VGGGFEEVGGFARRGGGAEGRVRRKEENDGIGRRGGSGKMEREWGDRKRWGVMGERGNTESWGGGRRKVTGETKK